MAHLRAAASAQNRFGGLVQRKLLGAPKHAAPPAAHMALSAGSNLFCFAACRRQATGVGLYFLSDVILCVSDAGFAVRVKDERTLAQQPTRSLQSCHASRHDDGSGRRLVLTFACGGGGDGDASHRARARFDLELHNAAEAALLKVRSPRLAASPRAVAVARTPDAAARAGVSTFAMRSPSRRRPAWRCWRAARLGAACAARTRRS
jgi:hypothetical protein